MPENPCYYDIVERLRDVVDGLLTNELINRKGANPLVALFFFDRETVKLKRMELRRSLSSFAVFSYVTVAEVGDATVNGELPRENLVSSCVWCNPTPVT